jgi:membrane protein DedA with SNARE-associated domain
VARFADAQGKLSQFGLLAATLWTTAGSVAGALVTYGVRAWLGRDRTRRLCACRR